MRAAWGHNFKIDFSRDRNSTETMRLGGTRLISNSSVHCFKDMMRWGAATPCPQSASRNTAAKPQCFMRDGSQIGLDPGIEADARLQEPIRTLIAGIEGVF